MGTAKWCHFVAAGLLAHLVFSSAPLAAQTHEADEKAILKQLEALRLADLGGDVTAMAPLLDDDLHNRNHYGNESTKPQRLELFKTYKPSQLSFEQVQVRFLGDSLAAVNGLKRESDGAGTRAVTFTHVWRKYADGWKVLLIRQTLDPNEGQVGPAGWQSSGPSSPYTPGLDKAVKRSGEASVFLASRHHMADPQPWGWLRQEVKADAYRGKRVRLTGYLLGRIEYGQFYAALVANDQDPSRPVAFDDTRHHELLLGPDWKKFSIVLDVPQSTLVLTIGLFVQGRGKVWADDWQFEIVGKDVPATSMGLGSEEDVKDAEEARRRGTAASRERFTQAYLASVPKMPVAPVNLDFEGKTN